MYKITYIEHSSFCVEFEENNTALLFDWYKGNIPEFSEHVNLYVFASHKHFDHYSKKVFELAHRYENVKFILSNEIKMNEKYMDRWNIPVRARERIVYVHKNCSYSFKATEESNENDCADLNVSTLASTDSGVAFLIQVFGVALYHAGDLNWWSWEGESETEEADMERRFKTEIEKLSQQRIDVAFLPLDPRQEDRFWLGMDYTMRTCRIDHVFPMHMWAKYDTIQKLKDMDLSAPYRERIVDIQSEGQVFEIRDQAE